MLDSDSASGSGRVAVLVDEVAELEAASGDSSAPAQSTASIISALESLGYAPVELSLKAEQAGEWLRQLIEGDFHFAFNLCETVGGHSHGEHLAAAAVELLGIPNTGATAASLLQCLDKDLTSALLRAHGIPVPQWQFVAEGDQLPEEWSQFPAIVKPSAEDASNGVHSSSVAHSSAELLEATRAQLNTWGSVLVQEFIEGREINLAAVGHYLLPPAEIDFSTLPDGKPRIVTFEAKWVEGSEEDNGTRPICPAPLDPEVSEQLQRLAARAWSLMGGEGYGRVDVRLSRGGVPYVIDVNPNPDLSEDAGLARQAAVAGWSYTELIEKIVEDALSRASDKAADPGDARDVSLTPDPRPSADDQGWVFLQPEAAQGTP